MWACLLQWDESQELSSEASSLVLPGFDYTAEMNFRMKEGPGDGSGRTVLAQEEEDLSSTPDRT